METDIPPIILQAQRAWEARQAELVAKRAQEAESSKLMDAATSDAVERLLGAFEAKSEAFRAELAKLDPQIKCTRHPDMVAVLNEEASFAAGKAVYRCPSCVTDVSSQRHERRIISAGIPADVRHATLENFDVNRENVKPDKIGDKPTGCVPPKTFLAKARAFSASEIRNLILCGTPGIGKGHLAAALALEALNAGNSVSWIDCATLFGDYHRAYATDGTESIIARYAGARLLVLDEVCLRELPADGEEILFAIFDRRHKASLPSILLGNAIADKVRSWLGGRITDRLRSGGVAFCYGEWESMRGTTRDGATEL